MSFRGGFGGGEGSFRANKRQRMNGGEGFATDRNAELQERNHKVAPSPVIHIRGLVEQVSEGEIRDCLQVFGAIRACMTFPNKRMALVEYETLDFARNLLSFTENKPLYINGKQAMFNYSTSQSINRPQEHHDDSPNQVVLLSIQNVEHPITVEVMHAVCSPVGNVVRIVIFRRNGVQAMVEFDSVQTAARAKATLHGADIYQNCCTIKAEFAKPKTLTVYKNEGDTWDFTLPANFGHDMSGGYSRHRPLLPEPSKGGPMHYGGYGAARQMSDPGHYGHGGGGGGWNAEMAGDMPSMGGMGGPDMSYGRLVAGLPPPGPGGMSREMPDCVLMVYGLASDRMNCNKLFNLLCLYGNVVRMKLLKSKDGSAMVQMEDRDACDRVMRMLNDIPCHGDKLQISFSKQSYVKETPDPQTSASFVNSRNNRFSTPEAAFKNRVCEPTNLVYFYNAPPNLEEHTLTQAFLDEGAPEPAKITMFPPKSEKSSRGLVEFASIEAATEAIAAANNCKLPNPGGQKPYVLKLSYSQPPRNQE